LQLSVGKLELPPHPFLYHDAADQNITTYDAVASVYQANKTRLYSANDSDRIRS